ncbi:LmeA family phospholipid-binding protein [Streptomyces sp. NPDC003691]
MRALRISLITAVVFGGLFVAADRVAVNMAESEVADRVRASQGLAGTPDVAIKGFPFLTQVFSKELDGVDVSLKGVTATADGRPVSITEVRAELSDVKINSDFSSAVAGTADGSGRVSYSDLSRAAPQGATVGYAGPERAAKGQVKVTGSLLDLLKNAGKDPGRFESLLKRDVTVYSSVELREGGTLRLKAEALPGLAVPGLEGMLRDVLDYELKLDGLPKPVTLDRVTAEEGGLKFSGTGKGVSLVG